MSCCKQTTHNPSHYFTLLPKPQVVNVEGLRGNFWSSLKLLPTNQTLTQPPFHPKYDLFVLFVLLLCLTANPPGNLCFWMFLFFPLNFMMFFYWIFILLDLPSLLFNLI